MKIVLFLLILFGSYSSCIAYMLTDSDKELLNKVESILEKKFSHDINYFNKIFIQIEGILPILGTDNRKGVLVKEIHDIMLGIKKNEGQKDYQLCINGNPQDYILSSYNSSSRDDELWSPNDISYAYIKLEKHETGSSNNVIIKDGKEVGKYYKVDKMGYSYNDISFAFIYRNDSGFFKSNINKDGLDLEEYKYVFDFEYGNYSNQFALVNQKDGIFSLYLNGKEIYTSNRTITIEGFYTSDDILLFSEYGEGGYKYINGEIEKVTSNIYDYTTGLQISDNGDILLYEGHIGSEKYLIINGIIIKDVYFLDIKMNKNGQSYAYHNGNNLIKDGKIIEGYGFIDLDNYSYSLDGEEFSFISREDGKNYLYSTNCISD